VSIITFFVSKYFKPENNRFCVPIDFATNRFTSEKFEPPPPLSHPRECVDRYILESKYFIFIFNVSFTKKKL